MTRTFVVVFLAMSIVVLLDTASGSVQQQPVIDLRSEADFSRIRSQSAHPVLVLFYRGPAVLDNVADPVLSEFRKACDHLPGVVTCTTIEYGKDPGLSLAAALADKQDSDKGLVLYPHVELWSAERKDSAFQTPLVWRAIAHRTKRALGAAGVKIKSKAQLLGLLETDKPLVLGYFPQQTKLITDPAHGKYKWWKTLAHTASRELGFVEVSNAQHLHKQPLDADRPFIVLLTNHWEERVLPDDAYERPVKDVAAWLVERSWGFARRLGKDNFDLFVGSRKPLFVVWLDDFNDANKMYVDLAHLLSHRFADYLVFGVASASEASAPGDNDTLDVALTYFGVAREKLPLVTILVPRADKIDRYLYTGAALSLDGLANWTSRFLVGDLSPSVLSQNAPADAAGQHMKVLTYNAWNGTIEQRGEHAWLVVFWTSQYAERVQQQMSVFAAAAQLLDTTFRVDNINVASYDLIFNDLPPGYAPLAGLVTPLLYLPEPNPAILSMPPDWTKMGPKEIVGWTYHRVAEHLGIKAASNEDTSDEPSIDSADVIIE